MQDTSSPLYLIEQQLEQLTLKQLIEIRVKVDELIEKNNVSTISVQLLEQKEVKNNSIENVNQLVSEWMQDESNYDEETYPLLEEGLKNNRFSI